VRHRAHVHRRRHQSAGRRSLSGRRVFGAAPDEVLPRLVQHVQLMTRRGHTFALACLVACAGGPALARETSSVGTHAENEPNAPDPTIAKQAKGLPTKWWQVGVAWETHVLVGRTISAARRTTRSSTTRTRGRTSTSRSTTASPCAWGFISACSPTKGRAGCA